LIGPPGTGKTLLARRLPTILPPLTLAEAIEVSRVWSVAGLLPPEGLVTRRPFRAPHHTVSPAGLVGGGRPLHPGEVSLAHLGVLFLDELPEFAPHALDTLRQPLEDGVVTVARAGGAAQLPAETQLVGAMNPCRRGCRSMEACVCTPGERTRYLERLSAPLLDRIDLHVAVGPDLAPPDSGATSESAAMRLRVSRARERQHARLGRGAPRTNARMTPRQLGRHCALPPAGRDLLTRAARRLGLSARGHDRVLKVARTIADLADAETIAAEHVAEALAYRTLERGVP
jgi:magnesium chelatase family protein